MPPRKKRLDPERVAQFRAKVQRDQALRQKSYREQALAIYPHVCARCGREFAGKNLNELTVHHKDNNHMNNPPNGSNWELLCLYCHDDQHGAYEYTGSPDMSTAYSDDDSSAGFRPFEGLKDLLNPKRNESDAK
jgi:5-methylcytosine-specific restriction endonuclease McrA